MDGKRLSMCTERETMDIYIYSQGYVHFRNNSHKDYPGLYLIRDNWDDYGYRTTYSAHLVKAGQKREIGYVKFGFAEMDPSSQSVMVSQEQVSRGLPKEYFSSGTLDYYRILRQELQQEERAKIFTALNDMAFNLDIMKNSLQYLVTKTSLFRSVVTSSLVRNFRFKGH